MEVLEMTNYGWWSVVPPLIAIVLALITKEVISSLLVGIFAGALIYSQGNLIGMLLNTLELMGEKIGENVYILLFLSLLGALVVMVTRAGGSRSYGEWASTKITSKRGACLSTFGLGCFIFIDDYFNCLSVGTVMRPVTDKYKISRAKLAYILDATAAPICIIAPISSWGASVATYIQDAGVANGMNTFIKTIPYNLYAILTLIMVILVCCTKKSFGPMAKFENSAQMGKDISRNDETYEDGQLPESSGKKGKVFDLVIPILALIIFTVVTMLYTGGYFEGASSLGQAFGNCDAPLSLVIGSLLAIVVTAILFLPRKVLSFKEFMESVNEGIKSMVPAFTILILAWTIGGICSSEYLNTGGFIGTAVNNLIANNASFPIFIIPVITFLIAGFLAFSTGTSWGTMAILVGIGVSICQTPETSALMIPVIGSILAGAVFGDHISPISDTTILSSTGAGCKHIDHISSQLVYASLVAICCVIGYIIMGILKTPWIPLAVSISILIIAFLSIQKSKFSNNQVD